MTTAVTKKDQAAEVLDLAIIEAQAGLEQATTDITRAVATAKAMVSIEAALTPEIMEDFKQLMDSPLGFKTDRPPGSKKKDAQGNWSEVQQYSDRTIKRVLINAFMNGARPIGNEINILVGNFYPTKEFFTRKVRQITWVRDFKFRIGAAVKAGEKTAAMPGSASWVDARNGEEHEIIFEDERANGGADYRIIVSAWHTDGPDQLRGKGESKLLRRAFQQMTGNDLVGMEDQTVEGQVVPASRLESKPANSPAIEQESPTVRAAKSVEAFAKFHVTAEMIEARIKAPIAEANAEHVEFLHDVYKSIASGESLPCDVFEFPPIAENDIRKRFKSLKSTSGIDKAGKQLVGEGADPDTVAGLADEYKEAIGK